MANVAQLVRAPVCGTGGRGFKSHRSPQIIENGADGILPLVDRESTHRSAVS